MWGIIIVAFAILAFCLFSGRLKNSVITPPMIFAAFGLVIGSAGLNLFNFPVSHSAIHLLAEITLVLVLFADAARIDLRLLMKDHDLPVRMLVIGMPLIIAFGTLVAYMLPIGLTLIEAALLAAVLAPTDAALGQSVVSNERVPVRIRQTLNVESGLNDGIAVPFVFLFAAIAAGHTEQTETGAIASFTALQLILGPLVGLTVGYIAGSFIKNAGLSGWMTLSYEGPAILAVAALTYALAQLTGGNGFIATFIAGLTLGYVIEQKCAYVLEFVESEGHALVLLAFLVFGAIMLPEVLHHLNWLCVLYAILSLTVIRMIPIAISLIGTGVTPVTIAFLGWFGPRGLASILFGLLVLEELKTDGAEMILATTITTVALSIILHGLTAAPLAKIYANIAEGKGKCPENVKVSEMPFGKI